MTEILIASAVFTGLIVSLTGFVLTARYLLVARGDAKLKINDERTLAASIGDRLIDALDESGIYLPTSCGGVGTCGLCRVQVKHVSSRDAKLPVVSTVLDQDEIARGIRLACQTIVRGDLDLTIPGEVLGVRRWTCQVRQSRNLAPLIKELILDLPSGEALTIPAGAYALITAPPYQLAFTDIEVTGDYAEDWQRLGLRSLEVKSGNEEIRAYSLANCAEDSNTLIFNVRLALPPPSNPDAPPGAVSSYLFGLRPGDPVQVSGPFGSFAVQDTDREMIFIGGGVGMAPLYAHIHHQLEQVKTGRRMSYWYGARSLSDLYYDEEMERLARDFENFSWHVVLSDPAPQDGWQGPTGFVHEAVYESYLERHPDPCACEYYLCGPPLMIEAVQAVLDRLGVPKDQILFDDFGG